MKTLTKKLINTGTRSFFSRNTRKLENNLDLLGREKALIFFHYHLARIIASTFQVVT